MHSLFFLLKGIYISKAQLDAQLLALCCVYCCIKLFFQVYIGINTIPDNTTVLLAFLVKALDNLRPGITNFGVERMMATSKLAVIIDQLTKNFVAAKSQPGLNSYLC